LVPTASFGGLGAGVKAIGALVSFASGNQERVQTANQKIESQRRATGSIISNSSFSGTSLLPGLGRKKGVAQMGANFTIPTLYQADPNFNPLIC
jgi:acyl-CoA synthetase (NDP forming)